ncbi:PqqD family peptide modification chaperone [Polaromonas sp. P1(28)-13]|nr:PqqD family peptide modification chaperone [Polaromonas sp. P1(28)-13]
MSDTLVSGSWYRVAPLKPSLVGGLKIVRQRVRNQLWHVLVEPGSGRQLRLNPAAYTFVGQCDGRATVETLWQGLLRQQGDETPGQDDILRLLAQLHRAGMLHFDAAPHLSLLFARRGEHEERRRRAFINPLMLRIPLFDPTRLLERLAPVGTALAAWPVFALWAFAILLAAVAAAVSFPQLKADALRVLATPASYAIAWVAYPIIKALHELAHALAVRIFGGAVHEVGISLLLLTPAPYVDASAANAFESALQRALVSAAGIMVELALAAGAMFAWAVLTPGLLRDASTVVLLICSISTLLFNGNPLLRLDGYHLLCDLLELPNLAVRSRAWWASTWQRWIGVRAAIASGCAGRRRNEVARGVRAGLVGLPARATVRLGALGRTPLVVARMGRVARFGCLVRHHCGRRTVALGRRGARARGASARPDAWGRRRRGAIGGLVLGSRAGQRGGARCRVAARSGPVATGG